MIITLILLIIALIILLAIDIAAFILIQRLLTKIVTYEKWILEFKKESINTLELMRSIDKQGVFASSLNDKGIFESDDQVGQIFKQMLELIEKLNERTE